MNVHKLFQSLRAIPLLRKIQQGASEALYENTTLTKNDHFTYNSIEKTKDQYEDLKSTLMNRCQLESIKTILFTGCSEGEGVSTTAINIAFSLASDSSIKVLAVDANIRTRGFSQRMVSGQAISIANLLAENIAGEMDNITPLLFKIQGGQENLYVLSCYGCKVSPVTFFRSEFFRLLLNKMSENFDYIIVDAPPIYGYVETLVLASTVDGVVLVSAATTRQQVAAKAKQLLEDSGAKVLGVVLTKTRHYIPASIYKYLCR
jgi:capsular exopolysaccharide synthesis family protein